MTSWTTPATWTANQNVSATDMNTQVRDNMNHLAEQISRAGWTSYTPTWTNLTVGNGTNTGKYAYAGTTTFFYVEFSFGTTSSIGGTVSVTFPDTVVTHAADHIVGHAVLNDASGSFSYGVAMWATTTTMTIFYSSVSGSLITKTALSSTAPFTWTQFDKIVVRGWVERA